MQRVDFKSFLDPYSIVVINQKGLLRKLYCPFRVLCIEPIDDITQNTWCYVTKVDTNKKDLIIYSINGKQVPFCHFQIYIMF